MAIATEKSVSESRSNLPDEPALRMLYRTRFAPYDMPYNDELTTHIQLGIPAMYLKMRELGSIMCQIFDMANGAPTDDDGVLAPTKHSMTQTTSLLIQASTIVWRHTSGLAFTFPRGFVSTDSEGGLRIEWTKPGASLRLVIAANNHGKSYLYYEFGDKYGSERHVTAELLGRWLVRFLSE